MKSETLETLLIDRALGELSPEVAELLDAWCAQHPTGDAAAAVVAATLQLAREATAGGAAAVGPLPAPTWRRPASRIRRSELLRLAACLVLGASLGWLVRPVQQTPTASAAAALPSVFSSTAEPTPSPSRFWSISARVEAARQRNQAGVTPESQRNLARPSFLKMSQPEPQS